MKSALAIFDFDGVICDSLPECLFSSYNAFQKIKGARGVSDIEAIPPDRKNLFCLMRPFVRSGEDFLLIQHLIEEGKSVSDQKNFDEIRCQFQTKLPLFKEALYKERDDLLEKNREQWLALNPLFPLVKTEFLSLNLGKIHILSTKRADYVKLILDHNDIKIEKNQITHSSAEDKISHLKNLLESYKKIPAEVSYIEDQVEYLVSAQSLGVGVFLVSWGYNSDQEKKRAQDHKIPIIEARDLKTIL